MDILGIVNLAVVDCHAVVIVRGPFLTSSTEEQEGVRCPLGGLWRLSDRMISPFTYFHSHKSLLPSF